MSSPGRVSVTLELDESVEIVPEAFLYLESLTVDTITPGIGDEAGGTEVTITGTGLVADAELEIRFGSSIAEPSLFAFNEDGTEMTLIAPPAVELGLVDVTITALHDEVIAEDGFGFVEPIGVTGLVPSAVPSTGGQRVVIEGSGFADVMPLDVAVGGESAVDVTLESDAEISFLTVPSEPDDYDVVLTHGLQVVTVEDPLTVYDPIRVDDVSPLTGPAAGGTRITVTGDGFVAGVRVLLGDVEATDVEVMADGMTLSATTPAGAAGVVDLTVQSPLTSDVLEMAFTYE